MTVRGIVKVQRWMFVAYIFLTISVNPAFADATKDSAEACFKRGEQNEREANKYANDVRDPTKWFDLALKNYLCAAQAGHVLAMWRVVNLSGSGQVEALPKELEDKYLHQAAEAGLADAQIAVGMDYCDNIGTNAPCKNPAEAEKWFLKAAKSGDADGPFELGWLYERGGGSAYPVRMEKALACYQLSSKRFQLAINSKGAKDIRELKSGLERPVRGVERTAKIFGVQETSVKCY